MKFAVSRYVAASARSRSFVSESSFPFAVRRFPMEEYRKEKRSLPTKFWREGLGGKRIICPESEPA